MLGYIKKMLPYPYCYLGDAGIIYSIAEDKKLRKMVKYNGELDQFEIPISELNKRGNILPMLALHGEVYKFSFQTF